MSRGYTFHYAPCFYANTIIFTSVSQHIRYDMMMLLGSSLDHTRASCCARSAGHATILLVDQGGFHFLFVFFFYLPFHHPLRPFPVFLTFFLHFFFFLLSNAVFLHSFSLPFERRIPRPTAWTNGRERECLPCMSGSSSFESASSGELWALAGWVAGAIHNRWLTSLAQSGGRFNHISFRTSYWMVLTVIWPYRLSSSAASQQRDPTSGRVGTMANKRACFFPRIVVKIGFAWARETNGLKGNGRMALQRLQVRLQ